MQYTFHISDLIPSYSSAAVTLLEGRKCTISLESFPKLIRTTNIGDHTMNLWEWYTVSLYDFGWIEGCLPVIFLVNVQSS